MLLVPPAFPLSFFVGLLSLALLGGGGYALWGWYTGALIGAGYLWGGVAALAWALFGRWVVLLLLGRGEADPPTEERAGEALTLKRPDGTALRVERYGRADGPTVLLTHGWGVNGTEWYYARRALGARYRVLVWDLRGLGASSRSPSGDYRVATMAADLEAVLGLAADSGNGGAAGAWCWWGTASAAWRRCRSAGTSKSTWRRSGAWWGWRW